MNLTTPFSIDNGRYEATEEIGRGSHAVVFRARDTQLGRDVAIKMLRTDVIGPEIAHRFTREIRITAQLQHPHIARVHDTGEWNGQPYFVSELAEGASLGSRIRREGPLPVDDAVAIASDIARALGYAHDSGVIHRDVKPDNILLTSDGALIADFGIAHAVGLATEEALITSTGIAVGTLLYMSPEQLCAERNLDGRSDQYSLALVLYEMLTGVRPHVSASVEGLRTLRLGGKQHAPRDHRPQVPEHIDAAVVRALSPAPADRFRSCHEFAGALEGVGNTTPTSGKTDAAGRKPTTTTATARWGSRRTLASVGVAAGIIMSTLALGAWNSRRHNADVAREGAEAPVAINVISNGTANDAGKRAIPRLGAALGAFDGIETREKPSRSWFERNFAALTGRALLELEVNSSAIGTDSTSLALVEWSDGERRPLPTLRFANDSGLDARQLRGLAARIVGGIGASRDSAPGLESLSTSSRAAVVAYVRAWRGLRDGSIPDAIQRLRASAQIAPDFAAARLWLAHLQQWSMPELRMTKAQVSEWSGHADAALRHAGNLASADSLNASGIVSLSVFDFSAACGAYKQAIAVDESNFMAHFGYAECLRRDVVVVSDTASPTGLRFRTSHHAALRAYEGALGRSRFASFGTLFGAATDITYSRSNLPRHGRLMDYDGPRLSAFPSAVGDSQVFWPIPRAEFEAGSGRAIPRSYMAALDIGRRNYLRFAAAWAQTAKQLIAPHLHQALAFELVGKFGSRTETPTDGSAFQSLLAARKYTQTFSDSLDVGIALTRIGLRSLAFHEARAEATNLLRNWRLRSGLEALRLAPLAALIGDSTALSGLLAASSNTTRIWADVPTLAPASARLYGAMHSAAALVQCEGLAKRVADFDNMLQSTSSSVDLPRLRSAWLESPLLMSLECLRATIAPRLQGNSQTARILRLLHAGEKEAARKVLDSLTLYRTGANAAAVAWDAEYQELWLLGALGDTTAALRRFGDSIQGISDMSVHTLEQVDQISGLRNATLLASRMAQTVRHPMYGEWAKLAQALGTAVAAPARTKP